MAGHSIGQPYRRHVDNRPSMKTKAVSHYATPAGFFQIGQTRCAAANDRFDRAMLLADEGAALLEKDKPDEAIAKNGRKP